MYQVLVLPLSIPFASSEGAAFSRGLVSLAFVVLLQCHSLLSLSRRISVSPIIVSTNKYIRHFLDSLSPATVRTSIPLSLIPIPILSPSDSSRRSVTIFFWMDDAHALMMLMKNLYFFYWLKNWPFSFAHHFRMISHTL